MVTKPLAVSDALGRSKVIVFDVAEIAKSDPEVPVCKETEGPVWLFIDVTALDKPAETIGTHNIFPLVSDCNTEVPVEGPPGGIIYVWLPVEFAFKPKYADSFAL